MQLHPDAFTMKTFPRHLWSSFVQKVAAPRQLHGIVLCQRKQHTVFVVKYTATFRSKHSSCNNLERCGIIICEKQWKNNEHPKIQWKEINGKIMMIMYKNYGNWFSLMNTHFLPANSVKQLTMDMQPSRKLKFPCQNATIKYING